MITLNATIEDHTISATSVDGHSFTVTFADALTGHESHHTMDTGDLMAVYAAAMLGADATSVWVAGAWYSVNPDAIRIIP